MATGRISLLGQGFGSQSLISHGVETPGITLSIGSEPRLAEVQESGCSGGGAGSGRGLGEIIFGRSLVASFFANRLLGELSRLHSSASRASLVHVRDMSRRMSRTRWLGARSANHCQSYARFLNIAGVSTASIIASPPT